MKPTRQLLSLIAVILASAHFASAQVPTVSERFDRLDRNRDGKLSLPELPRPDLFRRLDRNADGVIEQHELQAATATNPVEKDQPQITSKFDVAYGDHALQRLDLYQPQDADGAPIMVYVHGGGWKRGDKRTVGQKVDFFCGRGWVFVSANYRLLPEGQHPANVNDVAKAIGWVHDHAKDYGGDPAKLFVMGHSAGAHLAALVSTAPSPLKNVGKPLTTIRGVIPLDTNAYDVAKLMQSRSSAFYSPVFGEEEASWKDASPIHHVRADQGIPPFLICYSRGLRAQANPERPAQANAFARQLQDSGISAEVIDASDRNHGEINARFGKADDEKVTGAAIRFLDGILAGKSKADAQRTSANMPAQPEGDPSIVEFKRDYVAGSIDVNGEFMGGTETMRIVAHDGKLFAGNGYWTDQPGDDPRPGAQILRKDGSDQPWQVERSFPRALRISAMESVTFTTDRKGRALASPVQLLLADAGLVTARQSGKLRCFVRDDERGDWIESVIRDGAPRAFIRAFGFHRDAKTGVEHVYAGTGAGEIYQGRYDSNTPGRIRWHTEPEYANPDFDGGSFKRCQGFTVANGTLYASVSPRLLERQDGLQPKWKEVFRWKPEQRAGAGLRGITAIPAPDGDHEVIIGSREQEGRILRIDPKNDYAVTDELNSGDFFDSQFGNFRGGKLVAYNRFVPALHPATGAPIHWLTVAGIRPGDARAAWLLIRNADGHYEPVRVFDPSLTPHPFLVSTRTIEFAPWNDREFYTGGYDGAANNRKNHNTAWIFKGALISVGD
ncbi:alpha/beta hydrolase fold domain-containing protein [Rubinisphaera brasiliensis]|uniref:EF-hand domain-containing protein n=1 Tax=Rubinisphaera brasiliensis (strain ATCC 49424 / DSM 5305 / JCM 21570 / IAM 15109 / NBRC 103401 / IFAM 1448) TaxID=756272 RepID=F0SS28_RUBBR|nr:alpha/beta hydrolase fold domain-containing protein [Rubinisphaera brasiliensis]ADY61366.1 hypothetical protein Plabr_3776 [Rubinisphaera brasiliensis DSM 5305]